MGEKKWGKYIYYINIFFIVSDFVSRNKQEQKTTHRKKMEKKKVYICIKHIYMQKIYREKKKEKEREKIYTKREKAKAPCHKKLYMLKTRGRFFSQKIYIT